MTTEELLLRYVEETDILSDEKSIMVILFGSRITGDYKESSDLDVLVIVPHEDGYFGREKRMIDGIPVETIFMSKSTMMRKIANEYWTGSKFLESVLLTGKVEKSLDGVWLDAVKEIKRLSEFKKDKQAFSSYWQEKLDQILYQYRHANGNEKKLYYFVFINLLRMMYHIMNNYSSITDWKFYQMYTNKEKAKLYKLDLPDEEFIDAMVKALENTDDMEETLKKLFHFVGYTDYEKEKRHVYIEEDWHRCLSKQEIEKELMYLGSNVAKVEEMLLLESKEAECCYFLLLEYMRDKTFYIGPKDTSGFDRIFKRALDTEGAEERIRVLEELLHELDKEYEFDYDDYSL
ncbi:MAG: nucleotidyltransferase domain-containing protein [Bacilli bacterium]|nr:nucleotidyltransferase domain-containing protein [Bacilli bacterium]